MRFIIADEFYQQMLEIPFHTEDCYVRPGEYLHHMYIDGVKYVVAQAVFAGLAEHQNNSASNSLRSLGIAAIAALAIGVFSTGLPGSPAMASPSVTPFGAPPALAPSSLLLASK